MLKRVLFFSMRPFHCQSWPLLNWMPRSMRRSLSVMRGLFCLVSGPNPLFVTNISKGGGWKQNIPNLLHAHLDVLDALDGLPVVAHDALLALALVAEDVAVAAHEDVIALVVQRQDLAALQLGRSGEQALEQVRRQDTEGRLEVVEDQLRVVARVVCVPRQLLAVDPVGYAEVEVRALGQHDDVEAVGLLLVLGLHEDDERRVLAC
jgi:hypothetical protein